MNECQINLWQISADQYKKRIPFKFGKNPSTESQDSVNMDGTGDSVYIYSLMWWYRRV
jgi:hypothetical protein